MLSVSFLLLGSGTLCAQSPFRLEINREISMLGGSLLLGGINLAISGDEPPFTPGQIGELDPARVNSFDRSAAFNYSPDSKTASDLLVGCFIAAPVLFLIDPESGKDWQTLSVIYLETAALATVIPQIIKKSTERTRPFVYNPEVPLEEKLTPDARHSFLSGHSTWAFASAAFASTVYGEYFPSSRWKSLVWSGSFLIAATVGYLRYEAGYHFPTDILAGAGLGTLIGYAVPYIHKTDDSGLGLSASSAGGEMMVRVTYRW